MNCKNGQGPIIKEGLLIDQWFANVPCFSPGNLKIPICTAIQPSHPHILNNNLKESNQLSSSAVLSPTVINAEIRVHELGDEHDPHPLSSKVAYQCRKSQKS